MSVTRALSRPIAVFAMTAFVFVACAGPAARTAAPTAARPTVASATAAPATAASATVAPATAAPATAAPATASHVRQPICPATSAPSPVTTGSLSVLEWSGYEDPLYWADFQEKYPDVGVNFSFGISDADIYGKMKAGDQSDLFHPYTGWLQFYVDEGLVSEIDTTRLANWDKVPENFKAIGNINGKQYFVPFDWGFTSLLYNTDEIPSVTSWNALFDPQYDNRVSMWDDGPGAVTVSSYIHGWDETAVTDDQLAQAQTEWTAQAPLNRTYWASEYGDLVPLFENDEISLAYAWQGAYATLLAEGLPVAYANPTEGRNSWVGVYGINAKSANKDLALQFMDEKLGAVTGNNLVTNFYYGSANAEVMAGITDPTLQEAFSIDDPSILESTNFTPNLTAKQRDDWTAMWAEVKSSQ